MTATTLAELRAEFLYNWGRYESNDEPKDGFDVDLGQIIAAARAEERVACEAIARKEQSAWETIASQDETARGRKDGKTIMLWRMSETAKDIANAIGARKATTP